MFDSIIKCRENSSNSNGCFMLLFSLLHSILKPPICTRNGKDKISLVFGFRYSFDEMPTVSSTTDALEPSVKRKTKFIWTVGGYKTVQDVGCKNVLKLECPYKVRVSPITLVTRQRVVLSIESLSFYRPRTKFGAR